MKYVKSMGIALVAALALTAFAGVASASAAEFHTSVGSAALTGAQSEAHVFKVQGQSVTCSTAKFTGTAAAAGHSATQQMHPEYSGCTAFGFPASVATAGCQYNFHATGGTVDLESCTAGQIVITVNVTGVAKCVVNVKGQTGINGQTYTNQAENKSLVVGTASTNIAANVVTSTGLCPLTTGETTSTYNGTTSVVANGGAAEISVS
jgi:hypothetical protein